MDDITPAEPKRKPGRPPGFKGSSNRNIDYVCSVCGGRSTKEKLASKRILFSTIGDKPKTFRTRTVAWLCEVCMLRDPDFQREAIVDAPGNADLREKNKEDDATARKEN